MKHETKGQKGEKLMKTVSRRLENRMQDLRCSILHNWNMRRTNGPGVTPEDKHWFRCQALKAVQELRRLQQKAVA